MRAACLPSLQVYGPNPAQGSSPSDATIFNSMGVVAAANKQWLILQLLNGAAECLFPDADSQSKCGLPSSRRRAAVDVAAAEGVVTAADGSVAAVAADGVAPVEDVVTAVPVADSNNAPGRRLMM